MARVVRHSLHKRCPHQGNDVDRRHRPPAARFSPATMSPDSQLGLDDGSRSTKPAMTGRPPPAKKVATTAKPVKDWLPRAAKRSQGLAEAGSRYGVRFSPKGPRSKPPAPPPPSADLWPPSSVASPAARTEADAAAVSLKPSRGKAAAAAAPRSFVRRRHWRRRREERRTGRGRGGQAGGAQARRGAAARGKKNCPS
jgi:hypothetical protein